MTADSLRVPGANLYYKIEGSGPLLLLLQGGDGDADATDAIVGHLADRYAVLTYDRRGLSRSTIDDPTAPLELSTHTEDASRLLSSLTEAPVRVFGASIGALLGLDLITRHPEQVLLLLAHEPPATELLADPEREAAVRGQEEVEDLYRREGIGVAMRRFVALAGVDPNDREPDVDIAPPKPERVANLAFFLTHDAPAVRRYRLNLPALREHASRIVTAAGRSPGDGSSTSAPRPLPMRWASRSLSSPEVTLGSSCAHGSSRLGCSRSSTVLASTSSRELLSWSTRPDRKELDSF